MARRRASCEVRNLARYSPVFRQQPWQRLRIKDSDKGPEVWEVKWSVYWRKGADGLAGRRHCLIMARNVLTGEIQYFVAKRLLSQLFCARVRQEYDDATNPQHGRLTVEQVRSAMNVWLSVADMKPAARQERYERQLETERYYQRRNEQACKSHTKTRIAKLNTLGIDVDLVESCLPDDS